MSDWQWRHMRDRVLFSRAAALALGLALAACAPAGPPPTATLAPDRLWTPDPDAVIFRAEVIRPGLPALARQSAVPECTIYGDTRVVWVNALDALRSEVLFDTVGDAVVEDFITGLAIGEDFYGLTTGEANPEAPDEAYQQVLIDVGGRPHMADSRGNWDPDFFARVLAQCISLSSTPILFEPRDAWLTVQPAEMQPDAPLLAWQPAEHDGFSLAPLADGGPRWASGEAITALWTLLRTMPYTLLLSEDSRAYQFALQAPGVTRDAPEAPASP
jgi:hypothetical protein